MPDHGGHGFADYVLMLVATDSPEKEVKLADRIGQRITSGDALQVGTPFLADLRATAWSVWRDHQDATAARTVKEWNSAPNSYDMEAWRAQEEA
ncbi:hypothetical protein ACWCQK_41140 [Streptomyces sp. NPDC002306]